MCNPLTLWLLVVLMVMVTEFGDGDCDCVGDADADDDEILSQPFGVLAIEAGSLQLLERPYWFAERTYRPAQLY